MARLKTGAIPSLRHHQASGQAVVTLTGRDIYLGPWGSNESVKRYNEEVAQWLALGRREPVKRSEKMTVALLCARYMEHARTYYRKHGEPTIELVRSRLVTDQLTALFGSLPVAHFGVQALTTVREAWVAKGLCRDTINEYTMKARRIFSWGVIQEIVPSTVSHALREIQGLVAGRTTAPDYEPIGPAPMESVNALLAQCLPRVADLIRLQLVSGMRPGEACTVRPRDLERSQPVWVFHPARYKTEHHRQRRIIYLGPQAQAILQPRIDRVTSPSDYLFPSPTKPSKPYTVKSYYEYIRTNCLSLDIPHWHPNQLRHNALTAIRQKCGIDAARIIGGHADASMTTIYAQVDDEMIGRQVASEMG